MATSDLDVRRHASLELLRPICVDLMKDGTKEKVKVLREALVQVDDRIAQEIQQYILFPVQARLNLKDLSEGSLCELCETLVVIFQKTAVATVRLFMDTFNPLMFVLTPKDGSKRVVIEFEETKTSVIKALMQLFTATQEIVLLEIYCAKFVPALGQLVSVLLSFSELEKSRAVQKLALEALTVVLQRHSKFGKKYGAQLAELFPFCLPGVTLATCRIATGDTKQGHAVVVKAMEVFTAIVTLVLQDRSLDKAKARANSQSSGQEGTLATHSTSPKRAQPPEPASRQLCVERSDEWVKATCTKVKVVVERLCRLVSSDNWRVRLGLASLCEQLLASCSRSLSESLPKLLETMVGLINDPYGNVSRKALGALNAFSAAAAADADGATEAGGRTLLEILEENLHALASSLPRQIRMCDEDEKPALIRLLNGYIKLLGENISCVVNSGPHLSRLCVALVQALELDTRDLRIVEERGGEQEPDIFVDEHSTKVWKPRKYFKHFRDESILSGLLLACRQLGKFGNIHSLVDHLLDLCQTSATYRLAATLVINEMVLGAGLVDEDTKTDNNKDGVASVNSQMLPDVISLLMDEYLSHENLLLLDSLSGGAKSSTATSAAPSLSTALVVVGADKTAEKRQSATSRNTAVLQICLHMEGLANFSKVLGSACQDHLIRSLYPLVENLGHENLHISSTAYAALVDVAAAGGYRTLDALLRENADYLVSSVSLRLRHFHRHRRTPQTLCVMLRFCSSRLLPHVRRSVTQLLDSLDDNYEEDLVLFMPVLLELVTAVARWFPHSGSVGQQPESRDVKKPDNTNPHLDPDKLVDFLTDYLDTKRLAEGDFLDEQMSTETSLEDIEREMKAREREEQTSEETREDEDGEEKEKETPPHIAVVKEVFSRVRNLLSTSNGRLRVQALDVVAQGFRCLKGHERELLPQAHQIWAGLRPLFHNHEKFVVIKAVRTLVELSDAAGDFLRQRVVKEVLPGLADFMRKQAQISNECHSGYFHTANFKLQLCLLESVGPLASNLRLDRNDLDLLARLCVPYLCDGQPQVLQQASVSAFSHFVSLDGDAMWLLLCRVYCPTRLEVPGPDFVPVVLPSAAMKKNEYSTNVSDLFKRHYSEETENLG